MKNSLLKIFYVFIFASFSLHIFVLNLEIVDSNYFGVTNPIYTFFMSLYASMDKFDISWIILIIFLFDFYYNIYFVKGFWKCNKLITIVLSVIFSISALIVTSYKNYGNFSIFYESPVQIYKCLMVGIGYYFLIYATIKKILFVKNEVNGNELY